VAEYNTSEPWASIEDVAAHLGVRRDSVYRWIDHRGLPATKIGKLWKMKLSEVDTWMRARTGARTTPLPAALSANGSTLRTQRLVLVVDDDPVVRDTLEDFFIDEGHRVLLASDGAEALELLTSAAEKPALVVLDLKMPKLDGWRFREEQTRNPDLANIPVIVVTAVGNPALPGVKILKKPLHLDHMANAVQAALGESKRLVVTSPGDADEY
jgi:excisionase family DNA binding protein